MSKMNEEMKYLKLIILYLKNAEKILDIKFNEEPQEKDIDIFSKDLFESLYNNLLVFYKKYGKKNISTEEKKYFFSEILNLLEIICETSPDCFFDDEFCKSVLIYLIYSLKEEDNINIQTILKVFLNFENIIDEISSKKFDETVFEFENDIFPTIISLINRYESDFQKKLGDLPNNKNFHDIMKYLKKEKSNLPFYLKGFLVYKKQRISTKYLLIKIYKFFEKINPYEKINNAISYNLYQGYSLYGITSCKKILNESFISLHDFKLIKDNRINDINAKKILEIAIKLLEAKSNYNFIKNIKDENINYKAEPPKISNNFDDTKNYYQDLYGQLIYYLNQYIDNNNKACKIIIKAYSRVLWLNFCRLLILNLKENDIKTNEIKIIFYFIVNLFNPDADNSSSIEFNNDVVPILFSQCRITLLDYKEILKVIDIGYSKYYPRSNESDEFVKMYINSINEKMYKDSVVEKFTNNDEIKKYEVNNIAKYCNTLPFPLFQEYLNCQSVNDDKLMLFFDYCFSDLEDYDKNHFFEKIRNIKISKPVQSINITKIINIISNNSFLDIINDIMISPVMEDAYFRISNYYLTNGKININGEVKSTNEKNNLINGQSLFDYYQQFCKFVKGLKDKSNLFIVMGLPEFFKGFTFRFLKIVLNSEGIKFNSDENTILLKAYLVFVIIHEQNHYIKRFLNVDSEVKLCKTPKIGAEDEGEGGKFLITLLFGHALINKSLNLKQANYILDINNWRKKSVIDFKKDFLAIETKVSEETSIVYLSSAASSICDHSKLDA